MPAPEVWGPTTWTLFHTLAEHLREDAFHVLGNQLFQKIVMICSALPCPQCTEDATTTLRKVKPHDIDTKKKLIDTLYLFHNYVNAKKNKPLFDYSRVSSMYRDKNVTNVFLYFAGNYHTKGNMRLMTDSFRRDSVLKDVQAWLKQNFTAFVASKIAAAPPMIRRPPVPPTVPVEPVVNVQPVVTREPAVTREPPAPVVEPVIQMVETYGNSEEEVTMDEGVSMTLREKQ